MRPFLFALVLALAAGALGAYAFRRSRYAQPISPELARSALAREVAEARALGFEPQGEPEARPLFATEYAYQPVTLTSFELEAGECVAVVAAAQGWGKLSWLRLSRDCPERWTYRDPNDLSLHEHVSGVVAHVQFCAWEPTHAELCVDGHRMRERFEEQVSAPPTVVFQVLRASEEAIGGVARLNRGMLTVRDPAESTPPVESPPVESPPVESPLGGALGLPADASGSSTDSGAMLPTRSEVAAAMRRLLPEVRACQPSALPAVATAVVDFGAEGAPTSVVVRGVDDASARCIEAVLRGARVPPFSNAEGSFRVSYPFSFR